MPSPGKTTISNVIAVLRTLLDHGDTESKLCVLCASMVHIYTVAAGAVASASGVGRAARTDGPAAKRRMSTAIAVLALPLEHAVTQTKPSILRVPTAHL